MEYRSHRVWRTSRSGLTLVEVLVVLAILGIVVMGLQQVVSTALAGQAALNARQKLLAQGRYATERILMFIQESDELKVPSGHKFEISERILDTYDNRTRAYRAEGDGIPDADDDTNGLINDSDADKKSFVVFEEKSGQLLEQLPDYSTTEFSDKEPPTVLCENVADFKTKKLDNDLIEFQLTLRLGTHTVSWTTRGRSRLLDEK